jgi:Zn-dependent M28 family amino/carboxypeptidase
VIGGHLDSWDVGTGAHDDGAGCVIAMQALTVLRALELRPRRTIRVVLYTNEENGVRGARGYGAAHAKEKHVAAIESDSGAFAPWGFSAAENTSAERVAYAERLATLLAPVGATTIIARGSGVDIEVSLRESGALLLGLGVDGSTYFDYHHSHADTLDKVDPKWLAWDIAAMAAMAWLLAEDDKMPDPG